jgi:hypothetical protein
VTGSARHHHVTVVGNPVGGGATSNLRSVIPPRFEPVLAELRPLGNMFREASFRLYVVGGTVRDLLLDRATEQLDFDH